MACNLDHHAAVQYQCKSSSHYCAALRQGYKCSLDEWQHGRMVQNNSWSKARISSVNGSMGEWFRTTVGVRQGFLLSPTLLNIFLERIMPDALEEHDGKVSMGGRNILNLQFADDIDALAGEDQEIEAIVESIDKTCTRYKMEISAEKTKRMTNSANGSQRERERESER